MASRGRLAAPSLAFIACALSAQGCGTQNIDVGEVEAVLRLDLASCYGAGIDCTAAAEPPRPLERPEPATCKVDPAPPLRVAWSVGTTGGLAAIGPDDTLWLVGDAASLRWLHRLDPQGELFEPFELESSAGDSALAEHVSLAVDASGRGYLGLTQRIYDRERGIIGRLEHTVVQIDGDGVELAEPLEVEGVNGSLEVAIGSDGALLLSAVGEQGLAVLGRLDAERKVSWIQTSLPQAFPSAIDGDGASRTVVLGSAASQEPFVFHDSVTFYDARGNLVWDVRPGTALASVALHRDGSTVILGAPPIAPPIGMQTFPPDDTMVFKLSASGDVRWSRRFPDRSVAGSDVIAGADGNTYFANAGFEVFRIDSDGQCFRRAVAPPGAGDGWQRIDAVYPTSRGSLYFVDRSGLRAGVIEP